MNDLNPSSPKPVSEELEDLSEWVRSSQFAMDHAGTKLSYYLTVAEDGYSLKVAFRDGQKTIINIEAKAAIAYPFPSIEGTVVLCEFTDGQRHFYDVLTGNRLEGEELKKRDPHFYV